MQILIPIIEQYLHISCFLLYLTYILTYGYVIWLYLIH